MFSWTWKSDYFNNNGQNHGGKASEVYSRYLAGLGKHANSKSKYLAGLRDSVLALSVNVPGTTSKDVMDMVLVTPYFEAMKEIGALSVSNSIFITHGPGAVKDCFTD